MLWRKILQLLRRVCSHEIKRCLLLGRKAVTNLDSVLQSWDITLPTKIHIVKAMGFPGGSGGKESACNVGDLGSIPGLGRSPGGGHGSPLQYSCLANSHGQRSLAGYSPWGHKELDMTEWLSPVKAMVFPVVMYGCESWTIKKAECQRIDAFELWCWRRLLKVPWTAKRSGQSILNEVNPEYSLEELMLRLKLQYFGHLMWRIDSLEKTLMLGKIESRRRRGWQRTGWLDGITDSMDMSLSKLQAMGSLMCCSLWGRK